MRLRSSAAAIKLSRCLGNWSPRFDVMNANTPPLPEGLETASRHPCLAIEYRLAAPTRDSFQPLGFAVSGRLEGSFRSQKVVSMNKRPAPPMRLMFATLILASCIGCDQATKSIAEQTLQNAPPQSFLADTVRLDYALNPGGFLSWGTNLPDSVRSWIFIGFTSCTMLALCMYLLLNRQVSFAVFVSLVFVLAGGVGNLIDRISNHGLVTDFLNVGVGQIRTGVFNVADMAVTFGCIAAVLLSLRHKRAELVD